MNKKSATKKGILVKTKSKKTIIFLFLVAFSLSETFAEIFAEENKSEQNLIFTQTESKSLTQNNKKYPRVDFVLLEYLPSFYGNVTGENAYFLLNENSSNLGEFFNFYAEERMQIFSFNEYVTFGMALGFGAFWDYDEVKVNNLKVQNHFAANLSLGFEFYFHQNASAQLPLSGFCFTVYPLYEIPLIKRGENFVQWKSAFDIGYAMNFLDAISIYSYSRLICAWQENIKIGLDVGIALGLYLPDFNYYDVKKKHPFSR